MGWCHRWRPRLTGKEVIGGFVARTDYTDFAMKPRDIRLFEDGTLRDLVYGIVFLHGGRPHPSSDGLGLFLDHPDRKLVLAGIMCGLYVYLAVMVRCRFDCQILSARATVYRWLLLLYPFWILPALYLIIDDGFSVEEKNLRFFQNDPPSTRFRSRDEPQKPSCRDWLRSGADRQF
jgi:hypothetical protein